MTARWFRIANRYPNTRGPTIPFLLGALRNPPGTVADEGTSLAELRALIVAMRDETPAHYSTAISACGVIGQLIVKVTDGPSFGATLPSPSNPTRGLFIEPIYGLPDPDLDSLVEELWRQYRTPVLAGDFSYRHGAWRAFDDREVEEIRNCLTEHEEA